MLSGKELAAFEELICVADIADSANCAYRFLLFSYLDFRVYFACYRPEFFKIICLTCIWSKFVGTGFHVSKTATNLCRIDRHFSQFLKTLELGT